MGFRLYNIDVGMTLTDLIIRISGLKTRDEKHLWSRLASLPRQITFDRFDYIYWKSALDNDLIYYTAYHASINSSYTEDGMKMFPNFLYKVSVLID